VANTNIKVAKLQVFDKSSGKVLGFLTGWTIYINKDEGSHSRGTSIVGIILYIREISRYLEGEYHRGFRKRFTKL